jgi:hypothetical protein
MPPVRLEKPLSWNGGRAFVELLPEVHGFEMLTQASYNLLLACQSLAIIYKHSLLTANGNPVVDAY